MPKIVRTISIEYLTWEQAKKLNLNISGICEDALTAKVKELSPKTSTKYADAWNALAVNDAVKQRAVAEKWARETEAQCIAVSRELWNQSYRMLKEQNDLPDDAVERVKKREALFVELRRLEREKKERYDLQGAEPVSDIEGRKALPK